MFHFFPTTNLRATKFSLAFFSLSLTSFFRIHHHIKSNCALGDKQIIFTTAYILIFYIQNMQLLLYNSKIINTTTSGAWSDPIILKKDQNGLAHMPRTKSVYKKRTKRVNPVFRKNPKHKTKQTIRVNPFFIKNPKHANKTDNKG